MPIAFGKFTIDEGRRQLLRAGEAVRLSPKTFQLLTVLVHESPRAISKSDLQDQLWPGTFVTDGSLANLVTELRGALEDDARDPQFVRTLYGFGYSFTAAISDPMAVPQPRAQAKGRFGHLSSAAAFGALGAVLILASRSTTVAARPAVQQPIRSIAVLPFDSSGADRGDEYLGLGMTDVVISRLGNVRQLVIRPTSAIRQYAGKHFDSRDAGRTLKVDAVLEGSVRTTSDRVRVTVELLSMRDQKTIFAERFDAKRSEMFVLEDDISAKVAEALMMRLTPNEKTLLTKRYTANPQAYELYMEGRYEVERSRREGSQAPRPVIYRRWRHDCEDPGNLTSCRLREGSAGGSEGAATRSGSLGSALRGGGHQDVLGFRLRGSGAGASPRAGAQSAKFNRHDPLCFSAAMPSPIR